mmetsp:Transcript_49215/g.107048  ORF Transcript_49215/g.107048 Transcript_49215/m.107048 type:complete len:102 (+) Transcript_49215:288-593(+)
MLSCFLQFAVLLAMLTNLGQHTIHLCVRRHLVPVHIVRFGPAYMVSLAITLIMMHAGFLVLDVDRRMQPQLPLGHIVQCTTIAGYVLLFTSVLWASRAGKA